MKKNRQFDFREEYFIFFIKERVSKMVHDLRELHAFLDFYGVLSDELSNKSTELLSYKNIHIFLSLKKRIDNPNKFYNQDVFFAKIASQKIIDKEQLGKHWADFFLVCQELQTTIVNTFDNRLRFTDKSLNAGDISKPSIEDELCQLITHLYSQIRELKLKTHELIVFLNAYELTEEKTSVSSVIPSHEEHLFFSMPEEVLVSILTHCDIEDLLAAQIASKNLSRVAATAFAVRFKKNPAQVISHLSQIAPKEAYDFVEGYRCTSEYKALKSLVENKMPMSDHEVACYMLTRHHKALPDIEQLINVSNAPYLDEKTRVHLRVLTRLAQKVDKHYLDAKTIRYLQELIQPPQKVDKPYLDDKTREHLYVYAPEVDREKSTALFDLFKTNFPKTYLNLLPFISLMEVDLAGADLSHASLSHFCFGWQDMSAMILFHANLSYADLNSSLLSQANLRQANLLHAILVKACLDNALLEKANLSHANMRNVKLRQANLKQAILRWADLSGAVFEGTLIEGADFTGTNLAYARFINVDMRTIDLSQLNVEWTYLKKVRLVSEAALEDPEKLEDFFNSFEKNLVTHTPGSRMKWRIQMLKDLKRLMIPSALKPETKMLFLKKILAHYPPETFSSTIFIKKHPFKYLFEQFELTQVDHSMEEVERPLQDEVISILDELQYRIDNSSSGMRISLLDLEDRFAQCFSQVPKLTNVNQICQLSSHHFFLLQLIYFINAHNSVLNPYLVNYPQNNLGGPRDPKHYASQIFDGQLFDIEQLQTIQPEELETYLYGDEDFVINRYGSLSLNRVKLGGLLFSYYPYKKGTCSSVEIIDFQNRRLKFVFNFLMGQCPLLPIEMYFPLNVFGDLGRRATFDAKDIFDMRAGLELRASITYYIFATQKGPIPDLIPIKRIVPRPENKNTEACINARDDKDEIPDLIPTKRIVPCPENKNPEACINTRDDKDEIPLLGENRYGLYHRKENNDSRLLVAEKMLCVLT
ncbi:MULTISPECIES: pentapeptide repeat-containing protein [Legionella]|uniref:pentapeptide repeat-containing protein n=1 Tax=Legionella TaxID=445 RepID=UPI0009596D25|nr:MULTISPECIES: pentapeptide repeat-containing protein [Legionella]MBN9226682.1 pentapeptide repeat-containing protein [Legionella steelei]OJW12310.1 MAG: hypothetical protein BGO44_01660 [Legionella sp. 39-23]